MENKQQQTTLSSIYTLFAQAEDEQNKQRLRAVF